MLKKIQELVARQYGVSVECMLSPSRDANVAEARQVAMYVAYKETTAPLLAVAHAFGETHATVLCSVRTVTKRMGTDAGFERDVATIRERLEMMLAQEQIPRWKLAETEEQHWRRILASIQEAGIILDYLHWRVLGKLFGKQVESPLFSMLADADGELTEESVVEQLEAISRQARAGFVGGPGFPVFATLENCEDSRAQTAR